MSVSSETRVVSIQFDNKDFEKNVQQSLDTLERLNKSLEFKKGSKGLNNISNAASKVDMSSLSRSVDDTANHFSKLEVMGITALANITNSAVNAGKKFISSFIEPITKGGWQRALNMEKANFMFEGLDYTIKQIGKVGEAGTIMDNIFQSVDKTIYSLDRAAVLASQLMASGVEAMGKDAPITHVLKAVAGVASVYSADYERIGDIFAEVKAQGVLMGQQVQSLRNAGVPVYKVIGDYLNELNGTKKYTEDVVKDMISDQKIDFQTFSDAMEDAFGSQASKSKETFTGALEDMKAAAARIGESFYKPILNAGTDFYNATVPVLDAIKSRLTNEELTGPIDKFGIKFQEMVDRIVVGMDLFAAALNFDNTKEELEVLVESGLADESRLKNLEKYAGVIEKIRAVLDTLGKVASFLGGVLKSGWTIVSSILKAASPLLVLVTSIGSGIASLVDKLSSITTKMQSFANSAAGFINALSEAVKNSELLANVSDKINSFFDSLDGLASDLGQSLETLSVHISNVVYNLVDGLFNAIERIKEGFSSLIDMSDIVSTSIGFLLLVKFGQLKELISKTGDESWNFFLILKKLGLDVMASLSSASGQVYKAMFELKKTLEVYQRSLNSDILLKIALAIGALALSVKLLSTINATALLQGVGALAALAVILKKVLGGMTGLIKTMVGFKMKDMVGFFLLQTALIRIALALVGMATAVKILASLSIGDAIKGVVALKVLTMILVSTMKELSKLPKLNFLTVNLTFLALAIDLLAGGLKILSTMDWEGMIKGAVSMTFIGVLLVGLMKSLAEISKAERSVSPASLLLIALSIDMLAFAFKSLGKMSWEQVGTAVVSLITVCTALGVLMSILGKMNAQGNALSNAASLMAIAISLGMIGGTFAKLGNLGWDQIGKAAVGLTALFAFIALTLDVLSTIKAPEDLLTRIGALVGIAMSLSILVGAFTKLGGMDFNQLGQAATGLFALTLFVAAMVGLSKVAGAEGGGKDLLILSGAMIAMGLALQIFSIGMRMLGSIPIDQMAVSLIGFIAAVVALSYTAVAVQASLTAMLQLAGTIAVFGLSLAVVAGSMLLMGFALNTLQESLINLTGETAIKFALLVTVLAALSPVLKTAGAGMAIFGVGIAAIGIGMIAVGLGLAAIGLGLKTITTSMEDVVNSINAFANINWDAVWNLAGLIGIFGALSPLAVALGIGLAAVGGGLLTVGAGIKLIASGFSAVKTAISGIFELIESRVSSMVDKISNKLNLIKDSLTTFKDVIKALYDAMKTIVKQINNLYNDAYKSGKHVVDGVVKGIQNGTSSAASAARSLARSTLQAYKSELGISSPSKEMAKAGKWTVLGLVKGIEDNQDQAMDTMSSFANSVLSAYEYVSDHSNLGSTITPVIDATDASRSIGQLSSNLNSTLGAINAGVAAKAFEEAMNSKNETNSIDKLASKIDGMTETMNSRSLNNYITVDGASNPNEFADELIRSFRLNIRTT